MPDPPLSLADLTAEAMPRSVPSDESGGRIRFPLPPPSSLLRKSEGMTP
jgi:hypothetical protein